MHITSAVLAGNQSSCLQGRVGGVIGGLVNVLLSDRSKSKDVLDEIGCWFRLLVINELKTNWEAKMFPMPRVVVEDGE